MTRPSIQHVARFATAFVSAAVLVLGGAAAAQAAPSPITVSGLTVEKQAGGEGETLTQYDTVRFSGNWSADAVTAGDTFSVGMPAELAFASDMSFPLKRGAETVATCTAGAGVQQALTCVFDGTLEGKGAVSGDFWVEMSAAAATEAAELDLEVNGALVRVPLPGGAGITGVVTSDPNLESLSKYGSQQGSQLVWTIAVPASDTAGVLRIDDAMTNTAPNEWHQYDESEAPRVFKRPTVAAAGDWVPGTTWTMVDDSDFTLVLAADNTSFAFEMASEPYMAYQLTYYTKATGIVEPGDTFGNTATINGVAVASDDIEYRHTGGGGTETPASGRFSVLKTISGDAGAVPAGTEFTVRFTADGNDTDMTVTLGGDAVVSPRLAAGTEVTVSEVNLPEIAGVTWGAPVFTLNGVPTSTFTIAAGATLELELENSLAEVPGEEVTEEPTEDPEGAPSIEAGPAEPAGETPQVPLAATGGQSAAPVAFAGAALLLLGVGLVLARRKLAA